MTPEQYIKSRLDGTFKRWNAALYSFRDERVDPDFIPDFAAIDMQMGWFLSGGRGGKKSAAMKKARLS